MRRSLATGAVRLSVMLALSAGLAGRAPAQALKTPPLKIWRHGIIEAKSDAGILFMPGARDFAAKRGIKLELVQLKTDAIALKALLSGDLDSFEGGAGGAIVASARGADVKLVGCNWLVPPHGVFVRDNIKALADLRGKSVAVSAPGTFPEMVAKAVFEKAGIPVGELKLAAMGSDTDRYKALVAGVVDAALVSSEFIPIASRDGIRQIAVGAEAAPEFARGCLLVTGKTLAQRRDDAVRFLAVEIDGLRYAMSHRDDAIALAHEITGARPDDPRAAFVFDEAVRTHAIGTELPIPLDKLDYMQRQLVSTGSLPRPGDLEKFVDKGAREQALALVDK
jgi:NitT/TauT family transport system substrate-binding protein